MMYLIELGEEGFRLVRNLEEAKYEIGLYIRNNPIPNELGTIYNSPRIWEIEQQTIFIPKENYDPRTLNWSGNIPGKIQDTLIIKKEIYWKREIIIDK